MSDITYGWKNKQSVGKIYLNPEFTVGFRTIITGKEQKFSFDDTKSSFNGGIHAWIILIEPMTFTSKG